MSRANSSGTISGLMHRSLRGDRRAYDALVQTMEPRVRRFIRRRVQRPDLVDDLVQKTFVRVHTSLPRYAAHQSDGDQSVTGWFFTAAHRAILDHRRSEYRRVERRDRLGRLHGGAGFVPSADPRDPEQALSATQSRSALRRRVRSAVAALPPDAAEVVRRHKLEGESFPQIAAELGIAPATARVRAHRAYRKLAALLPVEEVA
ncbi:MAG: RNA polymerase sigma factor [Nannocystaceae bacterium]